MDRRTKFRQGLSKLYLPYYDALCGLLGPDWGPYCGDRAFQEQDRLWLIGRQGRGGKIVTRAKAGESGHNYGCASDWCIWHDGEAVWPPIRDGRWFEYSLACAKVGLRWGGDWNGNSTSSDEKFLDFPHNELLISCDWKHILLAYNQGGMTKAQQHILANMR